MSWTRRFIWVFWIFVITMLLWQFYLYNNKLSQPDAQPKQEHYFFYQHVATAAAPVEHEGPFVEQTDFSVEDNTPTSASFTCHVTLKNIGKGKATNVEVSVRPYRGAFVSDVDDGSRNDNKAIDDNSPLAQVSQWVEFPDLDPGESKTESVVFLKQGSSNYGTNPKPEVIYEPEKKK
jgi:hypothetical protein